jgi:hypothetical protein
MIWHVMNNYNQGERSLFGQIVGFPSKLRKGARMGGEEVRKWAHIADRDGRLAFSNAYDAQRHAEWTRRMTEAFGARDAARIAELYERWGEYVAPIYRGAPNSPQDDAMDRYNNAVGIDSVMKGRPYALDELQLTPNNPPVRVWGGLATYMPPEPKRKRR